MGDIQDEYSNPSLKSEMEQEANEDVLVMLSGTIEGKIIVIGVTASGRGCIATETEVCYCQ